MANKNAEIINIEVDKQVRVLADELDNFIESIRADDKNITEEDAFRGFILTKMAQLEVSMMTVAKHIEAIINLAKQE